MPTTKKQHYVPRFYMKPFSVIANPGTKKEKVLISFYNFNKNIIRKNVPVMSVCAEDFFMERMELRKISSQKKKKNGQK